MTRFVSLKNKRIKICVFYIGDWPRQVRDAFSNFIVLKFTCGI